MHTFTDTACVNATPHVTKIVVDSIYVVLTVLLQWQSVCYSAHHCLAVGQFGSPIPQQCRLLSYFQLVHGVLSVAVNCRIFIEQ